MADTTTRQTEARERLEAAVRTLSTSEGWAAYLESRAKFHRYSFANTMLIAAQRRGATLVAGYRKWQALGRQVQRGERGIAIFAPTTRKVETDDGEEETVVRFRVVHVFDVSQTDGEPLPQPCRTLEEGGDQADYMRLQDHAHACGLTVDVDDTAGGANGYIDRDRRRIVIGAHCFETGTPAQRIKTLAHELGHWHDLGPSAHDSTREAAEIVAEGVAYVVGHALGLDTSDYSAGYVLTWARGDVDRLRELAERIDRAARPILEAVTTEEADR